MWIALSAIWSTVWLTVGIYSAHSIESADVARANAVRWSCELSDAKPPDGFKLESIQAPLATMTVAELQQLLADHPKIDAADIPAWNSLKKRAQDCLTVKQTDFESQQHIRSRGELIAFGLFAVIPPVLFLLLGLICRWIYRGFRPKVAGSEKPLR